jgi:hypothetical protein
MKNDYKFNEKWFQDVKGGWDQCFDWYVNKQEREVRDVLEVGCYEGMASIYLAENYLKDGANYTVVDTFKGSEDESGMFDTNQGLKQDDFIYNNFIHNTGFFPNINYTVKRGISQHILPTLQAEGKMYDFIYIDGSHKSSDTFVDAYWAHKMLKQEGIIIYDDYSWNDPTKKDDIDHAPKLGIDVWQLIYGHEYRQLLSGYQLGFIKLAQ